MPTRTKLPGRSSDTKTNDAYTPTKVTQISKEQNDTKSSYIGKKIELVGYPRCIDVGGSEVFFSLTDNPAMSPLIDLAIFKKDVGTALFQRAVRLDDSDKIRLYCTVGTGKKGLEIKVTNFEVVEGT